MLFYCFYKNYFYICRKIVLNQKNGRIYEKSYFIIFKHFFFLSYTDNISAQISSKVEIKEIDSVSCYPKNTDIAIVNDDTSIVFSEIIYKGYFRNAFHLIKKGSIMVEQVFFGDGFVVTDIDVYKDTLCFCGYASSVCGFVAWTEISDFFNTGKFIYKLIPEVGSIEKIKPYMSEAGTINFACLSNYNSSTSSINVVQIDVAEDDYTISQTIPMDGYSEYYTDIIVYDNYILVVGSMRSTTALTPFGWSVRIYNKNDISQPVPYTRNLCFIHNYGGLTYENSQGVTFLVKSRDDKKLCLTSTSLPQGTTSSDSTIISVFDLPFNRMPGTNFINDNSVNRFNITSPVSVAIMWDADMCPSIDSGYDLVIQTFDGGYYSNVFHFKLQDRPLTDCHIYTNPEIGMFSSIKTYEDIYFVSVGDLQWNVGLWDRLLSLSSNYCDIYNYENTPLIPGRNGSLICGNTIVYGNTSHEKHIAERSEFQFKNRCSY